MTTTVVVSGVSGVGKSTIAAALAARLGWALAEGDDMHPAANIETMRSGRPLDDADRAPWLRAVAAWISDREAAGEDAVVTCSALRRAYRDVLADGHPSVRFCLLVAPTDLVAERLTHRRDHFMPASLLASQEAALEPLAAGEPGVTVTSTADVDSTVDAVVGALDLRP